MPKVVFLGSANMDTSIQLEGEFPDNATAECMNRVLNIMRTPGGKALNQALAFKKQFQDAEVCFVGCIGGVPKRDENGDFVIDSETGEKVLVPDEAGKVLHEILTNPDTGFSKVVLKMFHEIEENGNKKIVKTDGRIIQVDKHGQNRMTGYGDAIKQLKPQNIPELEEVLEGADMVVIQLKMPAETVRYVIDYCEKHNVKLLIDPTPLEKSKMLTENNCELLKKATYLSPNEEEAFALAMYAAGKDVDEVKALLIKTSPEQRAEMIKALVKTSPNVFATMGKDGVIFSKDGKIITQDTYPTICKDSTGAGDTFNGAFAAAIMRGEEYDTALLYGLYVSVVKVRESGAQNGVQYGELTQEEMANTERPAFVIEDDLEQLIPDEIKDEVDEIIGEDEPPVVEEKIVENSTVPPTDSVLSTDDNDGDEPR